jgi:hypothetical protein
MPTTKTAMDLFEDFKLEWEHALNPCMSCLLARAEATLSETEQDTLSVLLDEYLTTVATPGYSPLQMRGLKIKIDPVIDRAMRDPSWTAAMDQHQAEWRDKPWWKRRWLRLHFRFYEYRIGLRGPMKLKRRLEKQPWE